MEWKKIANRQWLADGHKGYFFIEQSSNLFWSRYKSITATITFKMPPKKKLREAKTMCELNSYWENEECSK